MELTLLENQIVIMRALLSLATDPEIIKDLTSQINFTKVLIRNFK